MIKEIIYIPNSISITTTPSKIRFWLRLSEKENRFAYNWDIITFFEEYEWVVWGERVTIKKIKDKIEVCFLDIIEKRTLWQKIRMFFKIITIYLYEQMQEKVKNIWLRK